MSDVGRTGRGGGTAGLLTIAYRNIWRNRRRTIFCVTAIAIAVFFNIFMLSWIEGMYGGIEEVVRTFETGHVRVVSSLFEEEEEFLPVQYPVSGGLAAEELVSRIEAIPGVSAALPRITAYATLFDSTVEHAILWGIDAGRERRINHFNIIDRDDGLVQGRFPDNGANEAAIGYELARKIGLGIGDRLPLKTVSAQFSDRYWSPTVVGIFRFDYRRFDESVAIVPFDRLNRLLVMGGATQQLFIYVEDPGLTAGIRAEVAAAVGPGHSVRTWLDNFWVAYMRQSSFLFYIIFGVFQIMASFLIINTILMVIHERIKEIGMMGALGMTRGQIVRVFFLEALILSAFGAAVGCIVAGAATGIGSLYPIDMEIFTGGGLRDMPISGTIFLAFSPGILARGFVFGVLVSAACTIVPSLRSAFIEPVEALRR
ncbi:MAG TPA: ABC transporter permease [Magnetospirillaceae bacterium]|nr:ABC transporter permease [Magnetospirillaceae bacterium]